MLAGRRGMELYLDAGAYPIAGWGAQRAEVHGVSVRRFAHFDPEALKRSIGQTRRRHRRPLVVADGFCPGCGRPAPLKEFLAIVRSMAGCLVLDDTQALGILGRKPELGRPYGRGGGGSLRWQSVYGADIVVVSSLAKGLGVPVAVLAGSRSLVTWFEANSPTRVHCSPPSVPVINAAAHALEVNASYGDLLRQRLIGRVNRFRNGLKAIGLETVNSIFPVQTINPSGVIDVVAVHERLLQQDIQTVLHQAREGQEARISFLITARHSEKEIDRALKVLSAIFHCHQPTRMHEEISHDVLVKVER